MFKKNRTLVSLCDIEDVKNIIGKDLIDARNDLYCIAVYAKRDFINELFVSMISDGYIFSYADFDNLDDMVKDRIYLMMISGDCRVSIEPAITSSGNAIMHDADKVLIYADDFENNCGKKIIDYCVNEDIYGIEQTKRLYGTDEFYTRSKFAAETDERKFIEG